VYPAGVNQSWQGALYAIKGVDDLKFTADLLAHLRQNYCIDSTQVYASGKSNGGGFVDLLACSSHDDEFVAFAMASAALYSDNSVAQCHACKARPILESHGEKDATIKYDGGVSHNASLPDIRSWIAWWAQRDGCASICADCKTEVQEKGYNVISYSCGGLKDVVQHIMMCRSWGTAGRAAQGITAIVPGLIVVIERWIIRLLCWISSANGI